MNGLSTLDLGNWPNLLNRTMTKTPLPFPAKGVKKTVILTIKSIIFVWDENNLYSYGHHFNVLRDYHFDVLFG
jgi:hypothetical protein